jgi:hypothetical protein
MRWRHFQAASLSILGVAACSDGSPDGVARAGPEKGPPWTAPNVDAAAAIDGDAALVRSDAASASPGWRGMSLPHLTRSIAIDTEVRNMIFDRSGAVWLGGSYTEQKSGSDDQEVVRIVRASEANGVELEKDFEVGENGRFGGLLASDDGVYVAGSFQGHLDIDGHTMDSVVNPGSAADNMYFDQHGKPSTDVFLLKLTSSGAVSWLRSFGGVSEQACTKLLRAPDGSLVMVGHFSGRIALGSHTLTSSGGSTREDMFVATLDASGEPLSARQAPVFGTMSDVVFDSRGNLIFGGFQGGSISVQGTDTPLGGGFIAEQDPAGSWLWASSTGPELTGPVVDTLTVDSHDNVIAAVSGYESLTLYGKPLDKAAAIVIKLDPSGNVLFANTYGGDYLDGVLGVATGPADSILITGIHYDPIDFGGGPLVPLLPGPAVDGDIFLAELDPSGAHRWSLSAGGVGMDLGQVVAVSGHKIASTGFFSRAIDFGQGRLDVAGTNEYLVWLDDP